MHQVSYSFVLAGASTASINQLMGASFKILVFESPTGMFSS